MAELRVEQVAHLLGVLAFLLLAARVAGHAATRIALPAVLGELFLGIALGPRMLNREGENFVWSFLGELGVLLLLFDVGLETRLGELRKVGKQSFAVAVLGIALTILLVSGVTGAFGVVQGASACLYLGAALAATSVGLTARVLRDLGQSHSREAKIILGAAVIDDILSLVVLALITALAKASLTEASLFAVALTFLKAVSFLVLAVLVGRYLLHRLFRWTAGILGQGAVLTTGLGVCLAYSWAAHAFGLAPAVGAFFAGLMIQPETYAPLRAATEGLLETHLESLSLVLVPLFFVLTGMKVDLSALASGPAFFFVVALAAAAVAGKVAAGLGAGSGVRRLMVGVGMVPRGEVGLIFAAFGAGITVNGHALLPPAAFASVVAALAITAVVSPAWLGFLVRARGVR
jgi:Kef-type K+ transport system membrane component KefB